MRLLFCMLFLRGLGSCLNAQLPVHDSLKFYEHRLADVMEVIDTSVLKEKCTAVEVNYSETPSLINAARKGIVYHEMALNFMFLTNSSYTGYAEKSYALLDSLYRLKNIPSGLLPFVGSYRASALSLVAAETGSLRTLSAAFEGFEEVVEKYAGVTYCPEFMRGSVAENLPWYFFGKRKHAKRDFSSIIKKYETDSSYANDKIMSFVYWAWANLHSSKKHRARALEYLDRAIALDPLYKGGRERAEHLKNELTNR